MYKVKAVRTTGPVTYACGTADQAYDRTTDLIALAAQNVTVIDPTGTEIPALDFRRQYEIDLG